MSIDLSDKKLYTEIQRTDNPILEEKQEKQEPQNHILNKILIIDRRPKKTLSDLIRKIIIVLIILALIYFTIYRFVIGYDFFKKKEYKKSLAVLSPELASLSLLVL
jgi:hypothetical protein